MLPKPTDIIIHDPDTGREDSERIRPDQILAEHTEWFNQSLRWKYFVLRGQVYLISGDFHLGDEGRIIHVHPRPELTLPGLEVNERLAPFVPDHW